MRIQNRDLAQYNLLGSGSVTSHTTLAEPVSEQSTSDNHNIICIQPLLQYFLRTNSSRALINSQSQLLVNGFDIMYNEQSRRAYSCPEVCIMQKSTNRDCTAFINKTLSK